MVHEGQRAHAWVHVAPEHLEGEDGGGLEHMLELGEQNLAVPNHITGRCAQGMVEDEAMTG